MTAGADTPAANKRLGLFTVTADLADLDAFCRATGRENDGSVPLTFPMRWLTLPDVRAAVLGMMPEADLVPVHESQSFDYIEPLVTGRPYSMALVGRRQCEPDQLIVGSEIASESGEVIARLETILRLVSTRAAA